MTSVALLLVSLQTEPLVLVQKGDIPIVISAPHGGRQSIPNCPLRVNKSLPQFVTVLDTSSDQLAIETANALETQLGKKPWLIVARFSRKYADANRPEEHGTESDAGREVYRHYHAALREAVNWCRKQEKPSLLLDIHSQGQDKQLVFRGTANGTSLSRKTLTAPDGFLVTLEKAGINLFPSSNQPNDKENPSFNGGWITRHYGAKSAEGIDAIQLEVGVSYRTKETLKETAQIFARALKSHFNQ